MSNRRDQLGNTDGKRPKRARSRPYTPDIDRMLRQIYSTHGKPMFVKDYARELGCSRGWLERRARQLGLSWHRPYTEEIDERLRRIYSTRKKSDSVAAYARELGCNRRWLELRAMELGLRSRYRHAPWTEREEEVLVRNIEHTLPFILGQLRAEGFTRSGYSVRQKLARMRQTAMREGLSVSGLALLMGVHKQTVARWIRLGMLKAERRRDERGERQGGPVFLIEEREVRRFVRRHPLEFDLGKVDQLWFLDLVHRGGVGQQRRSGKEGRKVSQRKAEQNEYGYAESDVA